MQDCPPGRAREFKDRSVVNTNRSVKLILVSVGRRYGGGEEAGRKGGRGAY